MSKSYLYTQYLGGYDLKGSEVQKGSTRMKKKNGEITSCFCKTSREIEEVRRCIVHSVELL